jgi:hypothetical protein
LFSDGNPREDDEHHEVSLSLVTPADKKLQSTGDAELSHKHGGVVSSYVHSAWHQWRGGDAEEESEGGGHFRGDLLELDPPGSRRPWRWGEHAVVGCRRNEQRRGARERGRPGLGWIDSVKSIWMDWVRGKTGSSVFCKLKMKKKFGKSRKGGETP